MLYAYLIKDYKLVICQGNVTSWNAWAKLSTEWSAVNIYANVYSVKDGKSLDEIRSSYEYPVQEQTTESD